MLLRGRAVAARRRAAHASDIPFFLGTTGAALAAAATARDLAATRLARSDLANFVTHGDPNGGGLPARPPYGTGRGAMLDPDAGGGAILVDH